MTEEDPLAEFRDAVRPDSESSAAWEEAELLVFEVGGSRYALFARDVASVIDWRPPAPVPEGAPALAGVVQHGGRIIAVVHDPLGTGTREAGLHPARIVVCDTKDGLIGLPADATLGIEARPLTEGKTLQTSFGAAVLVELGELVRMLAHR